jgi:transcriptional regulator with XRE-family HTH domain
MSVRLADVAAACGVDRSTASRALRGDPVVSAETTARIKKAAARLGYRPNQTARALRTGRTGNILLIAGSFQSTLEQEAARQLAMQFEGSGTDLYLATHQYDDGIYRRLLDKAAQGGFDGVVIIPATRGLADRYEETLYASGLPIVFLDRYPAESSIPVVTSSNAAAAALLAERMVQQGAHRLICYMREANEVSAARCRGCLKFAREHSIPCTQATSLEGITPPRGNTPLGILGISQHHVWPALEVMRRREPDTQLLGAVFDSWMGSTAPASEVTIAIQDFDAMARQTAALINHPPETTVQVMQEVPLLEIRTVNAGSAQEIRLAR